MAYSTIVRIIHISDLHVCLSAPKTPTMLRSSLARLLGIMPTLHDRILRELVFYNRFALEALRAAIRRAASESNVTTWLVCTGDLTTYGDYDSLDYSKAWLQDVVQGLAIETCVLYGNHDAWLGGFPGLSVDKDAVAAHVRRLKHDPTFGGVLTEATPACSVQLYAVNTVHDNPWINALSLGVLSSDEAVRLQTSADKHLADLPTIRLVASHHPLVVRKLPVFNGLVVGRSAIQAALSKPHEVHGVLSGHTHELLPAEGHLMGVRTRPLQLVSGASAILQDPTFSVYDIRFDADASNFCIDRAVWKRRQDTLGPFTPSKVESARVGIGGGGKGGGVEKA